MTSSSSRPGALSLLRLNPAFRTLTVARVVSFVGNSLSLVALMLHVASTTGQALAVAALLLAGDFVPSLVSPFTGAISDWFDRRRVMITCELVQAGLLLAIALTLPPLPLLLALVAARAIAGQVFAPASRAAIPSLVGGRDLVTGLAWAVAGAFTVQILRGAGIAAMDVATNTLIQRLVPDHLLGRVFGNLYGAIGIAAAISYIGGGLLLDATSAPTTFLVAGAAGILATLAVAATLPRAPLAPDNDEQGPQTVA